MDCKTARILAEVRGNRDNELPADDTAALDHHLQACPDCSILIQREARLDAPLIRVMSAVPVPANLKAKIFDRLATERGAVLRRKLWYISATAAAIIAVVGVATWSPDRRPKIDVGDLVLVTDQFAENSSDAANDWLASQGIPYQPPENFDSKLLSFHGTVAVKGKQVPMLRYSSYEDGGPVSAKVYLIRSTDFDLASLQRPSEGGSWGERGHQVKVYPSDQPDKLVYVVIYNSRSLDPFLKRFVPV